MVKPYCIGSDEWNGLSKLAEELGELQQVCGKLIGSQGDTNHWSGDLRAKFIEELGDVKAAMAFFIRENFDPAENIAIHKQFSTKLELFTKWDKDTRNVP